MEAFPYSQLRRVSRGHSLFSVSCWSKEITSGLQWRFHTEIVVNELRFTRSLARFEQQFEGDFSFVSLWDTQTTCFSAKPFEWKWLRMIAWALFIFFGQFTFVSQFFFFRSALSSSSSGAGLCKPILCGRLSYDILPVRVAMSWAVSVPFWARWKEE